MSLDVGEAISIHIRDKQGEYAGYQSTYKGHAYSCFLLKNGRTFAIEVNIDLAVCDAVRCHGIVQGKTAFNYTLERARHSITTPMAGYGSGDFVAVRIGDLKNTFGTDFGKDRGMLGMVEMEFTLLQKETIRAPVQMLGSAPGSGAAIMYDGDHNQDTYSITTRYVEISPMMTAEFQVLVTQDELSQDVAAGIRNGRIKRPVFDD